MDLLKRLTGSPPANQTAHKARKEKHNENYPGNEAAYWHDRFTRQSGELAAPGHSGLDETDNQRDYRIKREFFRRHLPRVAPAARADGRPARLLDAGCGPGVMVPVWLELGYDLTGIDFAPAAVDACTRRFAGSAAFRVNPLDTTPEDAPFDAVVCVDVLFHVVRDNAWEDALRTLAAATAPRGTLVIQESLDPNRRRSRHVRWRSRDDYRHALARNAMHIDEHQLYHLPAEDTDKDVLVCRHDPQN
jgi:SAM-dependent methyltransferase